MDDWLDGLAGALGVDPLSPQRAGALLKISREVAHGVERKYAPLSTYLIGIAVGSRASASGREAEAFESA
ncbi:MAG: DUF6457 domain-containing protein, partial [Actinobacteria bacterium]|nr:DUF6457 domain-containing protein [Actinomycetota bacterium]